MGYFSNGCDGRYYQAKYCNNCAHDINGDCPVWLAHLIHNYDECNKEDSILHMLIPRLDTGWNGKCKMYIPVEDYDPQPNTKEDSQ